MRCFRLILFLFAFPFALVSVMCIRTTTSSEPAQGFSVDNIDKSVDPCVDFYQYACGNWLKKSEIPPDQSQWVSFVELHERNLDIEHGILEKLRRVERAAMESIRESAICTAPA